MQTSDQQQLSKKIEKGVRKVPLQELITLFQEVPGILLIKQARSKRFQEKGIE